MGALDVCPFIPIRGVGMDECVLCAQAFGQRLAEELGVPGECPPPPPRRGALISGFLSQPLLTFSSHQHPSPVSAHDSLNMQIIKNKKQKTSKLTEHSRFFYKEIHAMEAPAQGGPGLSGIEAVGTGQPLSHVI